MLLYLNMLINVNYLLGYCRRFHFKCGVFIISFSNQSGSSNASIWKILKLNVSESPFIVIGCLFAIVHGGAQPIFGIIMGGFTGVSTNLCNELYMYYYAETNLVQICSSFSLFPYLKMHSIYSVRQIWFISLTCLFINID